MDLFQGTLLLARLCSFGLEQRRKLERVFVDGAGRAPRGGWLDDYRFSAQINDHQPWQENRPNRQIGYPAIRAVQCHRLQIYIQAKRSRYRKQLAGSVIDETGRTRIARDTRRSISR